MLDLLARTCFQNAKLRSLTGGIVTIYYADKSDRQPATTNTNQRQ
jgi:hypothetical protein